MSSLRSTVRRVGGPIAASLTILALVVVNTAAAPAGQAVVCSTSSPVLELANPHAGDLLPTGDVVISGVAFVPSAAPITGVSRVDLFLGSRDSGGLFIGSAVPVDRNFQITADVPNSETGGRDFVAYAYSTSTGQQTSVSVPVFIGAAPTATPTTSTTVATAVPALNNVATGCSVVAPGESNVALQPLPLAPTRAVAPFLQLANPSLGDILPTGDVIIQGVAYDPVVTSGSGIDRIDLFLDPREEGGTFLGGVTPSGNAFTITAKVANTANGGHTLVAYARSATTGHEAVVAVPLFVGTAPEPTPRPAS